MRLGVVISHALAPSRPPLDHMGSQIYQSRLPAAFLSIVIAIICFYNCKEGAGSPFPSRAIELCSAFSAYLTQRQHRTHLACTGGCHRTKAVLSIKLWDSLTARTERPLCLAGPGGVVKVASWPRVRCGLTLPHAASGRQSHPVKGGFCLQLGIFSFTSASCSGVCLLTQTSGWET